MGIPLWLGEFNIGITPQDKAADINQSEVDLFIDKFKEVNAWGWSFWIWSFREPPIAEKNYGLVNVTEKEIRPTKYFEYLKNALVANKSDGTHESIEVADKPHSIATNDPIFQNMR